MHKAEHYKDSDQLELNLVLALGLYKLNYITRINPILPFHETYDITKTEIAREDIKNNATANGHLIEI